MNRGTMMQLVEALNKAVANGDRESRFRGADELERYFNETGLDIFKDFDAAWMRFKMEESWKKREGYCLWQIGEIWPMRVPKFEKVVDGFC